MKCESNGIFNKMQDNEHNIQCMNMDDSAVCNLGDISGSRGDKYEDSGLHL